MMIDENNDGENGSAIVLMITVKDAEGRIVSEECRGGAACTF